MGFTEALTIMFVICKVTGVVTWNWWIVFLPEIIAGIIYLTVLIIQIIELINIIRKL